MNIKRLRHSHRLALIAAMMALAADAAAQSLDLRVLQNSEAFRKQMEKAKAEFARKSGKKK